MSENFSSAPIQKPTSIEIDSRELLKLQQSLLNYLKIEFGFTDNDISFINSEEMKKGIVEFMEKQYGILKSSLSALNFSESDIPKFEDEMQLMQTAVLLLKRNSDEVKNKAPEDKLILETEAIDIVSAQYDIDVSNIISQSEISLEIEPAQINNKEKTDILELSPESREIIQRKILTDFYIHGRSLGDLGGSYAFGQNEGYEKNAQHLALSAIFHIINFKTSMKMFSGDNFSDINHIARDNPSTMAQMGRAEMNSDDTTFSIKGMTPNEVSHEAIKALLEYITLDSLSSDAVISDSEKEQIKIHTEEPANEMLAGIVGPIIAKKLDGAFDNLSGDYMISERMATILHLSKNKIQTNLARLRFIKLLFLLPKDEILEQYKNLIKTGNLTSDILFKLKQISDTI
jgi:hypothetical protein